MRRVDLIQYRQRWKDDPELKCLGSARDDLLEMADALEASWSEIEGWIQWVYRIGLQLDWFTPAIGIDNRDRIEKAVKALKAAVEERDALLRGEHICRKCGLRKDGEVRGPEPQF